MRKSKRKTLKTHCVVVRFDDVEWNKQEKQTIDLVRLSREMVEFSSEMYAK